jgi:hypothetical protein
VPSANPRLAIPVVVGLSVALAGCVSTQTKNARLVIENERAIDSQAAVHVTRRNPQVAVTGVHLVRVSDGAAVTVSLRNLAAHPLSDLPISVGIGGRRGARYYLNRRANLDYVDTHISALGAGATTTWVLLLRHSKFPRGRLFADVGFAHTPTSTPDAALPSIEVAMVGAQTPGSLEITLENRSSVPQSRLPVYAVAIRAGRYVGAGEATIAQLSGSAHRTLRLRLLGTSTGATVQLFAAPTIFN